VLEVESEREGLQKSHPSTDQFRHQTAKDPATQLASVFLYLFDTQSVERMAS
jgi:hypothetical protein